MKTESQTLDQLCEFIVDCLHATAPIQDQGFPLIRTPNVGRGRLQLEGVHRVSRETFEVWTRRAKPRTNDLIMAREAPAGNVAIVGKGQKVCLGQRTVHLRPAPSKVHAGYLCFLLLTPLHQAMLLAKETGATAKHINLKDIRNHPIPPLPSLEKQKRIADILSAYDDLIENNRRRIELLEQAARLIYKEWFVHLRFPGHENVPVVDGVPEGWTCQSLAELTTKIGSGATPKGGAAAYVSEGISLFRSQNIYNFRFTDEGLAYINDEQAAKLSAVEVEPLDILLNITGASVGRCCIAPEHHLPARVNQHVMIIRMRSSACGPHFALHTINSYRPKERLLRIGRAGGSTREALTKDNVKQIQVQIPPEELRQSFESIAGNLFEQGQILQQQNSNLAEARDLLLPRLMSGQIRV